jgi:hypothetical protein
MTYYPAGGGVMIAWDLTRHKCVINLCQRELISYRSVMASYVAMYDISERTPSLVYYTCLKDANIGCSL